MPPISAASRREPRARCRARPTSIVGMLMSKLMVPAALIGTPRPSTNVGMTSSPPATPRRVLTAPMPTRKPEATTASVPRSNGKPEDDHERECLDDQKQSNPDEQDTHGGMEARIRHAGEPV